MKRLIGALMFLFCSAVPCFAQLVLPSGTGVVQAPIDANGWISYKLVLTQNVTSFSFVVIPNGTPPPSQAVRTVEFAENNVGGFTVVFASSVSNPCTITTTANAITICQFSFDATNNTWTGIGGGGGGGSVSGSYGPLAFSCTNCKTDVQYAFAVTCNSGSQTIGTGVNDPPFTAADATANKIIAGSAAGNAAANCPPQGTITGFTDAHHVTVSNAATATTTTGALAWGTQDDGPNLRNAFLASLGKGCLYLPVGSMFAGAPGSDSTNLFVDTRPSTATGFPTCVIGQANTIITPLPTFNYANCLANDACFSRFSPFANAQPQYGYLSNVELLLVGYNLTGTGTNLGWINWHNNTMQDVWLWCPTFDFFQISNGFFGAGPTAIFYVNTFFAANNGMVASGTGGTSAGLNQLITINQGYSQSHQSALSIAANAAIKTVGLQYGTPNNGPTITSSGIWDSWGEGVFHGFGTADSIRVSGGTTSLHGTWVVGSSGNTLGAVNCNTSGATIVLDGGAVDGGGGGGLALKSVAGCTIKARFPVQALNYAASLSGNNVSDPSETQTGACTTNAATVTFKLTYAVAPLVIVSDTTSASTGAQATATNTTTATIHCNGASDTFVATVIPNPI